MKPQELMALALRVLAVFIASQAFIFLAEGATFWAIPPENRSGPPLTALSFAWLVGPFIAAIVVWWCAPSLSRLAARGMANEPIAGFNAHSVISAAFVAAGTYIFIVALPSVVGSVIRAFGPPEAFFLPSLIASILKCLLGAALVVGSRTTSRFLLRLRYAGTVTSDL